MRAYAVIVSPFRHRSCSSSAARHRSRQPMATSINRARRHHRRGAVEVVSTWRSSSPGMCCGLPAPMPHPSRTTQNSAGIGPNGLFPPPRRPADHRLAFRCYSTCCESALNFLSLGLLRTRMQLPVPVDEKGRLFCLCPRCTNAIRPALASGGSSRVRKQDPQPPHCCAGHSDFRVMKSYVVPRLPVWKARVTATRGRLPLSLRFLTLGSAATSRP